MGEGNLLTFPILPYSWHGTHKVRFIEKGEAYGIQGPALEDSGVSIKKSPQRNQ